jgi:hypothetical protein
MQLLAGLVLVGNSDDRIRKFMRDVLLCKSIFLSKRDVK